MSDNSCKFYFDILNNRIFSVKWGDSNLNISTNCLFIGYYYLNNLRIFGSENRTKIYQNKQSKWTINNTIESGSFCTSDNITFNLDSKQLILPNGFISVGEKSYSITSKTLNLSNIEFNSFYKIYYQNNNIIVEKWDSSERNLSDILIGYIYNKNLYLFGVEKCLINVVDSSVKAPNPKIGIMTTTYQNSSNGTKYHKVTYDYVDKVINFSHGNYMYTDGIGYASTKPQTIEVPNIDKDLAYNIFYDNVKGTYTLLKWGKEQSMLPDDNDKYCIGYVYKDTINIFGIPELHNRVKRKTVYFFGDSITAGTGTSTFIYHQVIAENLNLKCLNYGIGSTGFCIATSSNIYVGNGVEGIGSSHQESGNNTILQTMQANNGFDRVSIWAGTNDHSSNIDLEEFKAAVNNTLDYALSVTPYVVCATPIRKLNDLNRGNHSLSEYCDIIKNSCEERGIPCFDAYNNSGLNPTNNINNSTFYSDGLHPNKNGHIRMGLEYENYIKLISW